MKRNGKLVWNCQNEVFNLIDCYSLFSIKMKLNENVDYLKDIPSYDPIFWEIVKKEI